MPSPSPLPDDTAVALEVATPEAEDTYDRDALYGDWIDADRDGENTRTEVLIEENQDPDRLRQRSNGTVTDGLWFDPYTGRPCENGDCWRPKPWDRMMTVFG